MVFSKKLPSTTVHPRRSAQALAKELEVELSVVLDALKSVDEYVASPRKKSIEEPVVRRIYEHLGRTYAPEQVKSVSPWQLHDRVGSQRARRRSTPSEPDASGAPRSFVSKDRSAGLGDQQSDTAAAWASGEWKLYGFADTEQDAWLAAGLRSGQAKIARDLRGAGLSPADLEENLYGWTVVKRLREGEQPEEVARLLRRSRAEAS